MELFSKLYNSYFNAVYKILLFAEIEGDITLAEMEKIIKDEAFSESTIYMIPNLVNNVWDFLSVDDNKRYKSVFEKIPKRPLSELEKKWLKALILDARFQLFFTDEEIQKIEDSLKDIDALFYSKDFYYFDQSLDGDDYFDSDYRANFRKILQGLREEKILEIKYKSSTNTISSFNYIPIRLEYSQKDDVFRLYVIMQNAKSKGLRILRLRRISEINVLNEFDYNAIDVKESFEKLVAKQPILLKISDRRNTLERLMLQFASYKKETWFGEEDNFYYSKIWYNSQEESELVIRILSFGPTVEILSPKKVRNEAKNKIMKQYELMYEEK